MTYALIALLCVYLLWVHYVAVMRLMQVRDAAMVWPYYEVYHLKDLGNKVQRTRFGYKIGNAMGNDPELTRAMVEDLCRRIKKMPPFK